MRINKVSTVLFRPSWVYNTVIYIIHVWLLTDITYNVGIRSIDITRDSLLVRVTIWRSCTTSDYLLLCNGCTLHIHSMW